MCNLKPGPRCFKHIQDDRENFIRRMHEANEKGNRKRVEYYFKKLDKLDQDEKFTPQGIEKMREQGLDSEADHYQKQRDLMLAASRAAAARKKKKKEEQKAGKVETKVERTGKEVTYDIPRYKVNEAKRAIEKMNARLERAGIEQRFEAEFEDHERIIEDGENGEMYLDERTKITLNRPEIKHDGYTFKARVEETRPGAFVVYSAPGQDLKGWRPESMTCDHCGKKRARSKMYVVDDEQGNRKLVGGQCLAMYTGANMGGLAALNNTLENDLESKQEDTDRVYRGRRVYGANQVLMNAYLLTKDEGYKGANYNGTTTREAVLESLGVKQSWTGNADDKKLVPDSVRENNGNDDEDRMTPDEIRAKVKEALKDNDSDWGNNLKTLMDNEYVSSRELGLFVSSMAVLHKKEKSKKPEWTQGFLGQPNEKIEKVKATVTRISEGESNYGYYPTTMAYITMRTPEGKRVFWSTSSMNVPEEGDEIEFKATVKKHDNYKGQDSTVITRAKWERVGAEPAPSEPQPKPQPMPSPESQKMKSWGPYNPNLTDVASKEK